MENKQLQAFTGEVSYSGPLPTASEFAGYNETLPGAAERLLSISEKETEHRRKMDEKEFDKTAKMNFIGLIMSFIIAIIALGAVFLSVVISQPTASIAPAIIAIPSILSLIFNLRK